MKIIGHKGGGHPEAENSIASIELGIQNGVDMVEVDIQRNSDKLYCFHDRRTDRLLSPYRGLFSQLNQTDIDQLNIPTLQDICSVVNRRVQLNIEIKSTGTILLLMPIISNLLSNGWSYNDIIISSFNHHELFKIRNKDPKLKIGLLYEGVPFDIIHDVKLLKPTSIHSSIDFVTSEFVSMVQMVHHLNHYIYTVNEPDDVIQMVRLGVSGIFTDFPLIAIQTINNCSI